MRYSRLLLLGLLWLASIVSAVASALAVASLWRASRIALGYVFVIWNSGRVQVNLGTAEEAYWGYWYGLFDDRVRNARLWQVPWIDLSESYVEIGLIIPWWLSVLITVALVVVLIRAHRGAASKHREACRACGYSLHLNVSGICPECGCVTNRLGKEECAERATSSRRGGGGR